MKKTTISTLILFSLLLSILSVTAINISIDTVFHPSGTNAYYNVTENITGLTLIRLNSTSLLTNSTEGYTTFSKAPTSNTYYSIKPVTIQFNDTETGLLVDNVTFNFTSSDNKVIGNFVSEDNSTVAITTIENMTLSSDLEDYRVVSETITPNSTENQIITISMYPCKIFLQATEEFTRSMPELGNNTMDIEVCYNPNNYSSINATYLEFNNTNYTVSTTQILPIEGGRRDYQLNITLINPEILANMTEFDHRWYIGLNNINGSLEWFGSNESINTTQYVYDVKVRDNLDATADEDVTILNITIYDEISGIPINLTVGANLNFLTQQVEAHNSDTNYTTIKIYNNTHEIIFNNTVSGNDLNLTWAFSGDITLEGTYNNLTYITRTITIPESNPIILNNNEKYDLKLYAIGVENSTTITYRWKTTDYVEINGIMRVYRCALDGTKNLAESIPISGGIATANLELLTAQYAYDVIVDGIVYQQESFYTCHVESLTERNYFVDISEINLAPVVGLYMIDCTLTKGTGTNVTMVWTANAQDSSPITGCLTAYKNDLNGTNEFFRNCTNTSFSLTREIPDPNISFYARGYIYQNDVQGYCRQDVTFNREENVAIAFGTTLLFGLMFLIVGLSLMYAGQSTRSLVGSGLAIAVAFFLGMLNLPWEWVASVMSVLIIVGLIIRYGRSEGQ